MRGIILIIGLAGMTIGASLLLTLIFSDRIAVGIISFIVGLIMFVDAVMVKKR